MPLILTAEERAALLAAQRQRPGIRHWRRYQAVVVRGEGLTVAQVARALSCTETSVYNWTAAYQLDGGVSTGRRRIGAPVWAVSQKARLLEPSDGWMRRETQRCTRC